MLGVSSSHARNKQKTKLRQNLNGVSWKVPDDQSPVDELDNQGFAVVKLYIFL